MTYPRSYKVNLGTKSVHMPYNLEVTKMAVCYFLNMRNKMHFIGKCGLASSFASSSLVLSGKLTKTQQISFLPCIAALLLYACHIN